MIRFKKQQKGRRGPTRMKDRRRKKGEADEVPQSLTGGSPLGRKPTREESGETHRKYWSSYNFFESKILSKQQVRLLHSLNLS